MMLLLTVIRSALFYLGGTLSLVIFSTLGVLLWPFSHKVRYQFMHQWARFVVFWLKITCGIRFNVHGIENIDDSKAGLVLARHESAWETFATQVIFPQQAFVLKRELLRIPLFGWGMAMLNPIAIDRGNGRQAMKQLLSEGKKRLDDGTWVIIFPEGTRMPPQKLGKIKAGGAMLAKKASAPVYLLAHNAGSLWPRNTFLKTSGTVDVYISAPIDVSDLSAAQLNTKTEDWFQQHLVPPKVGTTLPEEMT